MTVIEKVYKKLREEGETTLIENIKSDIKDYGFTKVNAVAVLKVLADEEQAVQKRIDTNRNGAGNSDFWWNRLSAIQYAIKVAKGE